MNLRLYLCPFFHKINKLSSKNEFQWSKVSGTKKKGGKKYVAPASGAKFIREAAIFVRV